MEPHRRARPDALNKTSGPGEMPPETAQVGLHYGGGVRMRWRGRRQSMNVQDRRSGGFGRRGIPLGIGRARLGRRSGIGGLGLLAVIVIALLLGVDPGLLLTGGQDPIDSMPGTQPAPPSPGDARKHGRASWWGRVGQAG